MTKLEEKLMVFNRTPNMVTYGSVDKFFLLISNEQKETKFVVTPFNRNVGYKVSSVFQFFFIIYAKYLKNINLQ